LKELLILNLSHNRISKIEGIEALSKLQTLDIAHNVITEVAGIEAIAGCPSLQSLDLSHNYIEETDETVRFFTTQQNIMSLYLKGNPCVRKISLYRKRLTAGMKNLSYLDDRPVFEVDRLSANAWAEGGNEAEKEARVKYYGNLFSS